MTRRRIPDCKDLRTPGTYKVELIIEDAQTWELSCPCCEGNTEHATLPGNNPNDIYVACSTCEGRGYIPLTEPVSEKKER